MKNIGIVTSSKELNYGAILQTYAMQRVVQNMGYHSELIWWRGQEKKHRDVRLRKLVGMIFRYLLHPSIFLKSFKAYNESFKKEMSDDIISNFRKFEQEQLCIKYLSYSQMKKYAQSSVCKAVIAGSDQIWNSYAVYVDPFYYLRFVPKYKRIAYAPSLGKNDIAPYNKRIMGKYVNDFPVLSVREKKGKDLLEKIINRNIEVVADPSLLLSKEEWKDVRKKVRVPEKYVLFYFLDEPNDACVRVMCSIVQQKKISVLVFPYHFDKFQNINGIQFVEPGPAEFLDLIAKAELVLTDSFHGTAFSINFNKQFYTFDRQYGNNQSQSSRLIDFLTEYGLKNRFVQNVNAEIDIKNEIDYSGINKKIEVNRESSKKFLEEAINGVED